MAVADDSTNGQPVKLGIREAVRLPVVAVSLDLRQWQRANGLGQLSRTGQERPVFVRIPLPIVNRCLNWQLIGETSVKSRREGTGGDRSLVLRRDGALSGRGSRRQGKRSPGCDSAVARDFDSRDGILDHLIHVATSKSEDNAASTTPSSMP